MKQFLSGISKIIKTRPLTVVLVVLILGVILFGSTFPVQKLISGTKSHLNLSSARTKLGNTVSNDSIAVIPAEMAIPTDLGTAQTRRDYVLNLIQTNPASALNLALNNANRKSLSPEIQNLVEQRVSVDGVYQELHGDGVQGPTNIKYQGILTSTGFLATYFANGSVKFKPGDTVHLNGVLLEGSMAVDTIQSSLFSPADMAVNSIGTKKLAIILFNFQDYPVQPHSIDQMRTMIFTGPGSVNAYYKEASFGKLQFQGKLRSDGDIFGWYTIPVPKGLNNSKNCNNFANWASTARQMAVVSSVDLSGYTNIMYAFPNVNCPFLGLATGQGFYGNGYQEVWLQLLSKGDDPWPTFAGAIHELGHNLGAFHSSYYDCSAIHRIPQNYASECEDYSSYDPYDIMGTGYLKHMNAYHKAELGWFNPSNVQTVTANSAIFLYPLEIKTDKVQVIKIPRDYNSNGYVRNYYYLEYRQPIGFDSTIPSQDSNATEVFNGVTLRVAPDSNISTLPHLINSNVSGSTFHYIFDSPLTVGESFYDDVRHIRITVDKKGWGGIWVNIEFTPPPTPIPAPFLSPVSYTIGLTDTSLTIFGRGFTPTDNTVQIRDISTFTIKKILGLNSADGSSLSFPMPSEFISFPGAYGVIVINAHGTSNLGQINVQSAGD